MAKQMQATVDVLFSVESLVVHSVDFDLSLGGVAWQ
jgi:hypothetical protein